MGREGRKNAHQAKPCRPSGRSDPGGAPEFSRMNPQPRMKHGRNTDLTICQNDRPNAKPRRQRDSPSHRTQKPDPDTATTSPSQFPLAPKPSPTIAVEPPFHLPAEPRPLDLAPAPQSVSRQANCAPDFLRGFMGTPAPCHGPLKPPAPHTAAIPTYGRQATMRPPEKIQNFARLPKALGRPRGA